jgi:hypothetical protein
MRASLIGILGLIAAGSSGCVWRLGDFTAVSTKNVPVTYDASTTVTGRDCRYRVLLIPLGWPNLKEAVDDAIGSRGNALVNQVTYVTNWDVLLVGQSCFEVKGDVVTLQ